MEQQVIKVEANPTKDFFIYMITRDIETRAAIVELIDNAIDGAKRLRKDGDYSGLEIRILFDSNRFTIEDNCGGFDIETATKYAFKFGRPSNRETEKGLFTGLYGIGMKRALFKLGKQFVVKSTTPNESFEINIDVDEWVKTDSWTFDMNNVERKEFSASSCGTKIEVTKLNDEQSLCFSNKAFENSIISYIEKYRSVEADKGLKIYLNEKEISFFSEELLENQSINSFKTVIKEGEDEIRIVAGVVHKGDPEKAGWYVFCNGRIVLFADKTNVTGWGSEYRSFHNSLASFRGYVYFESVDLFSLPWNTTKTGVDPSNRLYLIALQKMKQAVEQIGSEITRVLKSFDVTNIDEIPAINDARTVKVDYAFVHRIDKSSDFKMVDVEPTEHVTRIAFSAPTDKVSQVKERLHVKTAKDVGIKVFEYYCEAEDL